MPQTLHGVVGHHSEPWEVHGRTGIIGTAAGGDLRIVTSTGAPVKIVDWPRIVECVNALAGRRNPRRLRDVLSLCEQLVDGDVDDIRAKMQDALAALRGVE